MTADAATARIRAISRDFDDDPLAQHVQLLRETTENVVATIPGATATVDVIEQYPNKRKRPRAVP